MDLFQHAAQALLLAAGMFWHVGWSLILGFALSGAVQALVYTFGLNIAFGALAI